jgi:hypothetical protein
LGRGIDGTGIKAADIFGPALENLFSNTADGVNQGFDQLRNVIQVL